MTEPTWAALFGRASGHASSEAAVRAAVRRSRDRRTDDGTADPAAPAAPTPTRIVADSNVLVADLLVGGASRAALDRLREHSWITVVASDPLLAEAQRAIADLAAADLAADWRRRVEDFRHSVEQPPGDHPALASAYRGGAMHVLSLDETLSDAATSVAVRTHTETSVRPPDGFVRLFDPAGLYAHAVGGSYEGPDRDPRR